MSQIHSNEFERIKREYQDVVGALTLLAQKQQKIKASQKRHFSQFASIDPQLLEAAILTANDAYALLLMAKTEGFLRSYLLSLSPPVSLGEEPKLSTLIDKCFKEFNKLHPRIPIKKESKADLHDLRVQRNAYAHGYGSSVFPPVERIVIILGRFFDQLP